MNPGTRGDWQAVILHGKLISWAGGERSMVGSWDPELGDACLNLGGKISSSMILALFR